MYIFIRYLPLSLLNKKNDNVEIKYNFIEKYYNNQSRKVIDIIFQINLLFVLFVKVIR